MYVCVGAAPVAVPPSPNVHWYDVIEPSGYVEPAPLNDRASSVCAA
jgi:hypothetical protein